MPRSEVGEMRPDIWVISFFLGEKYDKTNP